MDMQTAFNVAIGLVAFLGGWVLNGLRDSINTLHRSDSELTERIQGVEVLVAGQYVKRDDMDRLTQALFAKLDKIEEKIDRKVDKQ